MSEHIEAIRAALVDAIDSVALEAPGVRGPNCLPVYAVQGHHMDALRAALAALPALEQMAADSERLRGGAKAIADERARQISGEGWSAENDDAYCADQLLAAASCYLSAHTHEFPTEYSPVGWPWHFSWWKPKDKRSNLVKAGALIAAEIDRLDRAAANAQEQPR